MVTNDSIISVILAFPAGELLVYDSRFYVESGSNCLHRVSLIRLFPYLHDHVH